MRIESVVSGGTQLILKSPVVTAGSADAGQAARKTIGEAPPVVLNLREIGELANLFAPSGLVGRLRKRLNHLKNKKCIVVPAKGGTVCVDDRDMVYLGVDFLQRFLDEPETIAGALAHEWGHSCALKPTEDDIERLTWNQIFELRRAHETLADEICGRLLYMMGYSPEGIIRFLSEGRDTHSLKYHAPEIREQVIRYGFASEKRKADLARNLFPGSTYKNEYHTILLDIA